MPVHFEWDRDLEEWDWSGAGGLEPPSEEFWTKFEELPDLGENLETLFAEVSALEMVRNHDCMWAGSCHSEDCKKEEKRRTVILEKEAVSLLVRPDTPQSSEAEDEEAATPVTRPPPTVTSVSFDHDYEKKKVIRIDDLGVQTPSDSEEEVEREEAVEEEEEEEVEEEEEGEEEEAEEESEEVEEESGEESEEEIDVVSVGSTNPFMRRSLGHLPTNPTTRVRHQLQETVADSLLTASRAVSRRLHANKRKRCPSFSNGRRLSATPKKSRFDTGFSADTEKRSLHNNMERMRRIDLRNAFEDLRLLIPTIADTHKAPKVTILKDATHYVNELNFKDRNLCVQIDALRSEQDRLRRTLSQLRRILAYKNIAH